MQQIKELLKEICELNEKMSKEIKNSDITKFISQCSKIHKELQPLSQAASNTNLFKTLVITPDDCNTPLKQIQITFFRGTVVFRVLPGVALEMSNLSKPCIEYNRDKIPLKQKFTKDCIPSLGLSFLIFGISYICEHLDEIKYKYEQFIINELQEKVEVLREESLLIKRK